MDISAIGGPSRVFSVSQGSFVDKVAPENSAKEEFLAYVEMTPAERMRATILEQMGMSEDQLASLDEETRRKIEEKIEEMIREKMEELVEATGGEIPAAMFVSISV